MASWSAAGACSERGRQGPSWPLQALFGAAAMVSPSERLVFVYGTPRRGQGNDIHHLDGLVYIFDPRRVRGRPRRVSGDWL